MSSAFRMRRRAFVWAIAAVAIAIVVAVGLRGRGKETPEKAIYAVAHDVEHRDAKSACDRLFSSTYLSPSLARDLGVRTNGARPTRSWEAGRRECERGFAARGEFETFGFVEPRVRSVSPIAIDPSGGVTGAASAAVSFDGHPVQRVKLVEYRGNWKVLVVTR